MTNCECGARTAAKAVNTVFQLMKEALSYHESVELPGIGALEVAVQKGTNNELTIISERALLDASGSPSAEPESPILRSAEKTAAWLIDEIAHGRNPGAADTRTVFEAQWKEALSTPGGIVSSKHYMAQLRQIPHACWRLRNLLWRREILQPPLRYRLTINGITVVGEYAVLRSSRRKRHAHVLYLRDKGIRRRPLGPDLLSFARRLDLENRWAEIACKWGVCSVGVFHYWVGTDFAAEHQPDLESARKALVGGLVAWNRP